MIFSLKAIKAGSLCIMAGGGIWLSNLLAFTLAVGKLHVSANQCPIPLIINMRNDASLWKN